MNKPIQSPSIELLVVDSLHAGLMPPQQIQQATATNTPIHSLDAVRARLLEWEPKYREANSSNTLKAVRADWNVFLTWCDRTGAWGLPISGQEFVRFLNDQRVLGKKRSTLDRYINTIRLIHKAAHLPDPTHYPDWRLDWRALVKKLADSGVNAPKQAESMRTKHVKKIMDSLDTTAIDLRDAALICLASDTLCRESELARLKREDIHRSADGWTVDVRRSKTDQGGLGDVRFCSEATKVRLDAWCLVAGITRGYLFIPIGRKRKIEAATVSERKPIGAAEVARIIRRRAVRAEIPDGHLLTGHSGRVGSCIELIENGATPTEVQFSGGWNSQRMVLHYAKRALAGQNAMAKLRKKQEQSSVEPESTD